ncbi:MAG: UDP-N-acetylmuramoyl-L-alanyl-D-glutamate--2,6-diaminopimelate ligase [Flavobacteriales bacterium]|nr:UDP-N-acetylmuramoyl-L-alanyl-D-glutamate--2,6-diaminopimelate ligase [Flavobacteriales bacterium]
MKHLSELIYKAGLEEVIGATERVIHNICFDSRQVVNNTLFIATRGTQVDGHKFIQDSIEKGAIAIVCEELPKRINDDVTYIRVKDSAEALGVIASNLYDNPSASLNLIGITGTNGKTTVVTLLYNLFRQMNYKVGLISTVVNRIDQEEIAATHTTPDALQLNGLLRKMVERGCAYCFMEVSSHSIMQKRVSGLYFAGGVFTNLTHDHLDYHGTFDNYLSVKKEFFDGLPSPAFALSNKDDKHGVVMLQNTNARKSYYSIRTMADFKCKVLENQFSGLNLKMDGNEFWSKLLGKFNAYNLLVAYSVARLTEHDKLEVLTKLSDLEPVDGRFDCFIAGPGIIGIVDYAHTPDALDNILSTINDMRSGNEILITVAGCGGDRDVEKRPLMAALACEKSDKVILTSDNPRSEEPEMILEDMRKGVAKQYVAKVLTIVDRKEAIKTACALARKDDIILVAGKGHEKYQEIKGERSPFDDKQVLLEACEMMSN